MKRHSKHRRQRPRSGEKRPASSWACALSSARARALSSDTRGAVYVEFLVAFVPLLLFFGAVLQLALLAVGGLMVDHSAVVGARAAVVVLPDDPAFYGGATLHAPTGQRLEDIRRAVRLPLLAFENDPTPEVTFPSAGGGSAGVFGQSDIVRVRVAYDFPCRLPFGGALVCAGGGGRVRLHGEAAMPNQGAGYAY